MRREMWRAAAKLAFAHARASPRSPSFSSVAASAAADGELRVFVVAGEVSGDTIASRLMASLRRLSPVPVRFSGVGGSSMCKEGLLSLFPIEDIAVMGIWELLPHLKRIMNRIEETTTHVLSFQPHVVVTIDSKGFSFRFLRQLKAKYSQRQLNTPLHVHYVAPSFWAWKGGEARLRGLGTFIDHMLCILPFEEEVCLRNGIAASFVGHPILEDVLDFGSAYTFDDLLFNKAKLLQNGETFQEIHGLSNGTNIVTMLPGSRLQEVTRMMPIFFDCLELLKKTIPDLTAVIPVAPNQHVAAYIQKVIQKSPVCSILVDGSSVKDKYDAFRASRFALCTSGTAVMELLLAQLPCIVAYRAHFLTEWIIQYKANQEFISLPNILLNSSAIPEALFQACNPENLSRLVNQILSDPTMHDKQTITREKVIRLLLPPKVGFGDLVANGSRSCLSSCRPSEIAASTILYSAKKS